mmetsp:Transcript_65113/g.210894  ORF Transcript_65113/g.210894 Transcript_65113/m.210894 type:complete len:230 (-) Transcript_65113:169-858(-)
MQPSRRNAKQRCQAQQVGAGGLWRTGRWGVREHWAGRQVHRGRSVQLRQLRVDTFCMCEPGGDGGHSLGRCGTGGIHDHPVLHQGALVDEDGEDNEEAHDEYSEAHHDDPDDDDGGFCVGKSVGLAHYCWRPPTPKWEWPPTHDLSNMALQKEEFYFTLAYRRWKHCLQTPRWGAGCPRMTCLAWRCAIMRALILVACRCCWRQPVTPKLGSAAHGRLVQHGAAQVGIR